MDVALWTVEWQSALVCLDDVVVFVPFIAEHINHSKHTLTLVRDVGVTLNLKKQSLFRETIDYLCQVIRSESLEIVSHTRDDFLRLQAPQNVTKLKSDIRLCDVLRRFVSSYAGITSPRTNKLWENEPLNYKRPEKSLNRWVVSRKVDFRVGIFVTKRREKIENVQKCIPCESRMGIAVNKSEKPQSLPSHVLLQKQNSYARRRS